MKNGAARRHFALSATRAAHCLRRRTSVQNTRPCSNSVVVPFR